MPQPIIIANWKMNFGFQAEIDQLILFKERLSFDPEKKQVAVCPSFLGLARAGEILVDSKLLLGAQDCFWYRAGAYTGQVSPTVLVEAGCSLAIVGHSEKRQLGETDEMVNKKTAAALAAGLEPVICLGETFEERQAGHTAHVVSRQLQSALVGIDLVDEERIIIAYEPVWVIGSGQAVDPEEAEEVFQVLRQALVDLYPLNTVHNSIRLIYGGSVEENNVRAFMALEHCQGLLVGGASLDEDSFNNIIKQI